MSLECQALYYDLPMALGTLGDIASPPLWSLQSVPPRRGQDRACLSNCLPGPLPLQSEPGS